ncbi:hypothetical protein OHD62_35345 [Mesorhizobium sp. YC-39]|nr:MULTISPECIES: hypothetical protein [unclassified Mesorhizobium]MCV3211885.1 hypothetical protein [Mesorhizobium sp. YC-2]MCV3233608.1 hypothetical protein [Mesorhizobium sp. YC-39]
MSSKTTTRHCRRHPRGHERARAAVGHMIKIKVEVDTLTNWKSR